MFNFFTNRTATVVVPTALDKLLTDLKLTWLEQLPSDIHQVETHLVKLDQSYVSYAPTRYQQSVKMDSHAVLKLYTGTAVADYYPKDTAVYRRAFGNNESKISYLIAEQEHIDFAYRLVWYPYVLKGSVTLSYLAEDVMTTLQSLHQDNITHLNVTLKNLAYDGQKYHLINFEHGNLLPQVGKVNVKTVMSKNGKVVPIVTRPQADCAKLIGRDNRYNDLSESMAIDKYQLAVLLSELGAGESWNQIITLLQHDADWKIIRQAFEGVQDYDGKEDFVQVSPM